MPVRGLQRSSPLMKGFYAVALVALLAGCHFDKLFSGGERPLSHGTPAGLVFPVVVSGGDQDVLIGAGFTLQGASFSDRDHDGPWTVTIDWGDGTTPATFNAPSEGSIPGSHSYAALVPATYTLTITVVDSHGGGGTGTKKVNVHL